MTDKHSLQSLLDFKGLTQTKRSLGRQKNEDSTSESSDNEVILRTLKELRQNLKTCQKDNILLKEQIKIQRIRQKQNQQALQAALSSNIELKDQAARDHQNIQQLRKKVAQLKSQLDKYSTIDKELSFTKEALLEARISFKSLVEENSKKAEVFLQERIQMQEQIIKLKAKVESDQSFILSLQQKLSRKQEDSIKLENKMRKMSISYQEDAFSQKWTRQNFETQHLLQTISELEKQIQHLKNKLSSQKQRRFNLQDQLLELQESTGLTNVKASTFEQESEMLLRKNKKLAKKVDLLKQKLWLAKQQKLGLQEQISKHKLLIQQVIVKLKSNDNKQSIGLIQQINNLITKIEKNSPKSIIDLSNSQEQAKDNSNQQINGSKLQQLNSTCLNKVEAEVKKYQSNPQTMIHCIGNRYTFGFKKQNQDSKLSTVEIKIRKQREQMQRRIRQKLYQRNIQCSMPHQTYRIRSEYINSFMER